MLENTNLEIDLLFGMDFYYDLVQGGVTRLKSCPKLRAVHSHVGDIITGPLPVKLTAACTCRINDEPKRSAINLNMHRHITRDTFPVFNQVKSQVNLSAVINREDHHVKYQSSEQSDATDNINCCYLPFDMHDMWKIETLGIVSDEPDFTTESYKKSIVYDRPNKQYIVELPCIPDMLSKLPNNRVPTMRRFDKLISKLSSHESFVSSPPAPQTSPRPGEGVGVRGCATYGSENCAHGSKYVFLQDSDSVCI